MNIITQEAKKRQAVVKLAIRKGIIKCGCAIVEIKKLKSIK